MIDDELRPIVTQFVAEMFNDPCCEYILLDVGEGAKVGSDQSVLYLNVIGKQYEYTFSVVRGGYLVNIRDRDTGETITTIEREEGAWELQELLGEIRTRLWEDR